MKMGTLDGAADQSFLQWLDMVTAKFSCLTDEERNLTFDSLIAVSGASQLRHLHDTLENLVHRDFLKLLPPELKEYLLTFLDSKSLLVGCCVSKTWNNIISSSSRAWQRACITLGIEIDKDFQSTDGYYWKSFFLRMAKRCHDMKTCKAFEAKTYERHLRRVTAVHYARGKLATAADNRTIQMWDCATDECLLTLRTDASVTAIKFDEYSMFVSSYLGHLVCWDVNSGERKMEYMRHVGAVFSFDYARDLDVLVSGSADTMVKVWSLSRGSLLTTLHSHSVWVLKVLLRPLSSSDHSEPSKQHLLFSMDRSNIMVWIMGPKQFSSKEEGLYISFLYSIPINGKDTNFFTPGLHFDGRCIFFMMQDPSVHTSTVLCKWDVRHRKMISQTKLNVKVKVLLGVGRKYAAVITPWKSKNSPNFVVFSLDTLESVAAWHLPPSRPSTPVCSQVTMGECDWLNGLNGKNDNGLLLAAGVDDNTIYVIKWRQKTASIT